MDCVIILTDDAGPQIIGPNDVERTIALNDGWAVHIFKARQPKPVKLSAEVCGESLTYG